MSDETDEPEIRDLLKAAPHMHPRARAKTSKLMQIMAQAVMAKVVVPNDEPKKEENE